MEDKKEFAYMLTAYERYGTLCFEDLVELYIDEVISEEITIENLGDYQEFLADNRRDDDFIYNCEELQDYIYGMDPMEIFRLGAFSRGFFSNDYFVFNGYGNVEGICENDVVSTMQEDRDFLKWYVSEKDLIDPDDAEEIIELANKLIEEGY